MSYPHGQIKAYTLGLQSSYDHALEVEPMPVMKIGKRSLPDDVYPGGWVWRSYEDAKEYMDGHKDDEFFRGRQFAVYRLTLPNGWDMDVYGPDADGIHNLLHDAVIVGRVIKMDMTREPGDY